MRIGILGGSFNPVHMGHLILASDALERAELDRVLLVPCGIPPHKRTAELADSTHRVEMLTAAVADDQRLEVCTLEVERGGVSYTIDTVRELKRRLGRAELWLIMGTDCLYELHTWKAVYELLTECNLAVFARPGEDRLRPERIRLQPPWPERLISGILRGHQVEISSSEIRRRVASGASIRYFVPPPVERYIREHGLYSKGDHQS